MANPSPDKGSAEWTAARRAIFAAFGECVTQAMTPTEIADRLLAAATPPSPSTAPEADPEKDFSDWMERRGGLGAGAVPERIFFAGHSAGRRSALASRPAEVDDEGLPPLPVGRYAWEYSGGIVYDEDEFRQGQRDAVAADRAKVGRAIGLLREARAALENWKDVAPAVSLCADIDKVLTGGGQ